jgi:hypothetical protein
VDISDLDGGMFGKSDTRGTRELTGVKVDRGFRIYRVEVNMMKAGGGQRGLGNTR